VIFPNTVTVDPENSKLVYVSGWGPVTEGDVVGGSRVYDKYGREDIIHSVGGVFKSEDGGVTWRQTLDSTAFVYSVAVDPSKTNRLIASTYQKKIYFSEDYGNTWKKLKDVYFWGNMRAIFDPQDPKLFYLGTFGSSMLHGPIAVE
jgi:photosystem II stability/assembly factor-like uncharacterized protein